MYENLGSFSNLFGISFVTFNIKLIFRSKSPLKSEASLALPKYKFGSISTAPFFVLAASAKGLLGKHVFSAGRSSFVIRKSERRMNEGPTWSNSSDLQMFGKSALNRLNPPGILK